MKKQWEPFWWSLFGAGGVLSALFLPAMLFLTCIAFPLGWIEGPSYENVRSMLSPLLVRLALFGLITFSLLHWAHRFRFTLDDGLQLHHIDKFIAFFCYGSAIGLSIFAGVTLFNP